MSIDTPTPPATILLHSNDNVAIATRELDTGADIRNATEAGPANGGSSGPTADLCTTQRIPLGHKVAVSQIPLGTPILKYGQPIGVANETIAPGDWVHVHNVDLHQAEQEFEFARDLRPPSSVETRRTFQGYRRASGDAGTRNYVAVISSVNCSATVSKAIARHFTRERLREYPNVDGVVAFTHHGGCAMQFAGQQHQILNRVLGGIARHPNIGGFVLVGLGCEKASIDYLVDDQRLIQIEGQSDAASSRHCRPPVLTLQSTGGTAKTIAAGIDTVMQLLPEANAVAREPIPVGELVVATQCGGSDGHSGVTANPALGVACDLIVAHGGTAILGETTEMVGAEHLLTRRAVSEAVGRRLLEKIEWWRWYAGLFGEQLDDNRSAGNAAGGLTTIAEKSLGAVAKAGSSPLMAVIDYAQRVAQKGFVIMDSPGFDPASITGMVAGGANLVAFTTGRGSCYGCKPSPSIKIATNSQMYARMIDDMDLDAGRVLRGTPLAQVGQEIFEMMVSVASGEPTKSEAQQIGDEEFVPWMLGPVL